MIQHVKGINKYSIKVSVFYEAVREPPVKGTYEGSFLRPVVALSDFSRMVLRASDGDMKVLTAMETLAASISQMGLSATASGTYEA